MKKYLLKEMMNILHCSLDLPCPDEVLDACKLIITAQELEEAEVDTLTALIKRGPLRDGDVPSKGCLYRLTEKGLSSQIIVGGEDGYNAANYDGLAVYRIIEYMKEKR